MMRVAVAGRGVLGPGLPDWPSARALLLGAAPYQPAPVPDPAPALLPATERRRASASVRWALSVGQQALDGRNGEAVATVFASCGGDGVITHQICEALASAQGAVSPTRFHNSVHNAPAGYWSIATRSQAPSTSLSGFDGSFAIGLLEAAAQATVEGRSILLIAYDLPYPEPLHALWPVSQPFAAALLVEPAARGNETGPALQLTLRPGAARPGWADALPAALRDNPAAAALPVLAAGLPGHATTLALPINGDSHLAIEALP